jgi:hypothetical protein
MTRSADHARRALSSQGAVKGSAADALRAALSPPKEPERKLSWLEIATELKRANDQFEAEREAQRQAEADAPPPGETAAQMLARALRGSETTEPAEGQPQATTSHIPLNGPGVLRAVLGAIPGATIHGGAS